MEQFQRKTTKAKPNPIVPELLAKWHKEAKELRLECTELQQRNDELTRNLKRIAGDWMQQREAIKFALEYWFDRVYPPDIFIGGPSSDPGVNEVREVANKLRAALEREHNGSLPATDG